MHRHRLPAPDDAEVLASLQRVEPDKEAQDEGEERAGNHHPSLQSEPLAVRREREGGERDDEGREDEQRVDQASFCTVSSRLAGLGQIIPVSGHSFSRRVKATLADVRALCCCCLPMREKATSRPPQARKRKLTTR